MRSGAIATSSNSDSIESKGYNHLVTLNKQSDVAPLSATVIAPTCTEADSLATALFAMAQQSGMEKALAFVNGQSNYHCQWQTKEGVVQSAGWSESIG